MHKEDKIIQEIRQRLIQHFGEALHELWLFGSRSRGDNDIYSDYDLLVVVDGKIKEVKKVVQEVEWLCMEKYEVLVSSIVYTPGIWEKAKNSPLGINIQKDGFKVA